VSINLGAYQFELRIKKNSKNKIITYISITVKHEDNQGKPSSYSYPQRWILPNILFIDSEEKYKTTVIKFFPKEDRLDKELLKIEINEVRYVDFILKE
jgi:hypothetical protein